MEAAMKRTRLKLLSRPLATSAMVGDQVRAFRKEEFVRGTALCSI